MRFKKFYEITLFALIFIVGSNRVIFGPTSLSDQVFQKTFVELVWWIVVFLLIIFLDQKNHQIIIILRSWKRFIPLIAFILIAFLSLTWTSNFPATLYKVFVLCASSIAGAYLGVSFSIKKLIQAFAWIFGLVAIANLLVAIFFPKVGVNIGFPYYGAWQGIYWSKNYMGPFMAFGNMLSFFVIFAPEQRRRNQLLGIILYIMTLTLVVLSRCATAIILMTGVNGFFLLWFIWFRIKDRLKREHYVAIGCVMLVALLLIVLKANTILGFFKRDTTFSGRNEVWPYLFKNEISKHPWMGSGFGAFWDTGDIRQFIQHENHWGMTPFVADNGYIDILLHLGILGLVPFLATLGLACFRSLKYSIKNLDLLHVFPTLVLGFILVLNIILSFFLEMESLTWLILMIILLKTSMISGINTVD